METIATQRMLNMQNLSHLHLPKTTMLSLAFHWPCATYRGASWGEKGYMKMSGSLTKFGKLGCLVHMPHIDLWMRSRPRSMPASKETVDS